MSGLQHLPPLKNSKILYVEYPHTVRTVIAVRGLMIKQFSVAVRMKEVVTIMTTAQIHAQM
jgi:hypothetical protein